ncbi:retrovirus-related pol polyprotein from transposon TNT 1-94 [Tanacetum coccineum]
METIHVTFDELTVMASEQFSSGVGLQLMTPATSSSGLVPNPITQQPFNPPMRNDWDRLFQPMFNEYFNPPLSVVSPVPVAVADNHPPMLEKSPVQTTVLPCWKNPCMTPWIFKVKKDECGSVLKNKARLVAKGYQQEEGIDFEESFAPVLTQKKPFEHRHSNCAHLRTWKSYHNGCQKRIPECYYGAEIRWYRGGVVIYYEVAAIESEITMYWSYICDYRDHLQDVIADVSYKTLSLVYITVVVDNSGVGQTSGWVGGGDCGGEWNTQLWSTDLSFLGFVVSVWIMGFNMGDWGSLSFGLGNERDLFIQLVTRIVTEEHTCGREERLDMAIEVYDVKIGKWVMGESSSLQRVTYTSFVLGVDYLDLWMVDGLDDLDTVFISSLGIDTFSKRNDSSSIRDTDRTHLLLVSWDQIEYRGLERCWGSGLLESAYTGTVD